MEMATWSGLGLSGGPAAAAAAGAAAVVAGVVGILPETDVPDAAPPAEISAPAPEAAPVLTAPETEPPLASSPAPLPDVLLETVRIDPFGNVVVAGRAFPRAEVSLRVDGLEILATRADRGGNFAAVFTLGTADQPRLLSSAQRVNADGEWLVAADSILVAPILAAIAPEPPQVDLGLALAAPDADTGAGPDILGGESEIASAIAPGPALAAAPEIPAAGPSVSTVLPKVAADQATEAPAPTPLATQAPRVLRLSPAGVEVVQGSAPDSGFEIAAISYDEAGDVVVSGTGAEAGSVQLYLNNAPVQTGEIDATGAWQAELEDVESGVYTLRIDEVGQDGRVVSRVETPFERSDPAVVRAALAQSDGVISAVTVQPGYTLWSIAEDTLGDGALYVQVFAANRDLIRDPDLIYPGQIFALPRNE